MIIKQLKKTLTLPSGIRRVLILTFPLWGLGGWACKNFELPAEKTLKTCQTPTSITATPDVNNPKQYTFALTGGVAADVQSVIWKATSGTTTLATVTNTNANSYAYNFPNDGSYTVAAEITTLCGTKTTLTATPIINTPATAVANTFLLVDPMVHSGLESIAVTNDGTVIANDYNAIKVWDYKNKTLLRTITGHTNNISELVLSVDEKYLFSSSYSVNILVHDWKTGTLIRTLTGHTNSIYDIAISADNKYLVSGSADNTIKIWNVADGSLVRTINVGYAVYKVSISNDAQYLAAMYYNNGGGFKVFNGQTGTEIWNSPNVGVNDIALNPTGTQLWVAKSNTYPIELYNISTKQLINTIPNSVITSTLAMSIDGKYIYTAGGGSLTIDGSTVKALYTVKVQHASKSSTFNWVAQSCTISVNNQYACSSSFTGSIALCPLLTGDKVTNSSTKHPNLIENGYLSKDKKSLISNDVSSVRIWDLATGTEKTVSTSTPVGSGGVNNVGVMTNNIWLKSCGIEQHSLSTGAVTQAYISATSCGDEIAVSPDDKVFAIAGSSATIQVRDAINGNLIRTLSYSNTTSSSYIFDDYLEFTPDNKYLISGNGTDKTIRIWEVATGNLIRTIKSTINQIDSGILSADGAIVALADYSKVEIYNVSTGTLVNSISHNNGNTHALSFSPDGKNIAVGGIGRSVRIFYVATGVSQKSIPLTNRVRNLYYNTIGTQLYAVTEKDFQVINVQ